MNTQKIGVKQFRQIALKELSADNNFLAGWVPNSIIDHAVDPLIGKLRPWTKAGREYHNFYRNFYCTLAWTKLWKICKFDQTSWNLDDEVIRNVSNKFNFLIEYALDNIDENLFDDERNVDPKDWLENYNPELISRYTAMDHLFQNITNNPIKNVLDFGSGIGRQAFQWFKPEDGTEGVNLFSVDAIESLYVLQNKIYSLLYPKHLREYFYDQETFRNIDLSQPARHLYHLPTWRMDQLPSNSFDLIICVQVLNELNEETLMHLLKQFGRIAKENCVLYIRDNELGYTPGHGIRVGRLLPKYGFELLFRYNGLDAGIEGKPRVWAYTGVEKSTAHLSLKYRLMTACSYCGGEGRLRSLRKSVMATIRDWGLPI